MKLYSPHESADSANCSRSLEDLITVNTGKYTVKGLAISGFYSVVMVENLNVCFDMGIGIRASAKYATVCISHGHHDHCGGLYRHNRHRRITADQKEHLEAATYYIPAKCMQGIRQMYLGFLNLDSGREDEILAELHPNYVVAEPDNQYWIHRDTFIQPFKTIHRVPSQGYTVFQRRMKLKPEYANLDWTALKPLKDSGADITAPQDIPLVSYTGDTILPGVLRHSHVMQSELLIIECTFLDAEISQKEAHERSHIHIEDLIEHQNEFKAVGSILLCHFSNRYKQEEIKPMIMNRLSRSDVTEQFRRKIHVLA